MNSKEVLIKYRMEQAKESIDNARFLLDNNRSLRLIALIRKSGKVMNEQCTMLNQVRPSWLTLPKSVKLAVHGSFYGILGCTYGVK
jgi:hypothetical protein